MAHRVIVWAAAVLTVIGWAPLVAVFVASWVADQAGCALDEGSVHPCLIGPVDVGGLLYSMGVSGWLMLVTWPLMFLSVVFWPGYVIATFVRSRRNRS